VGIPKPYPTSEPPPRPELLCCCGARTQNHPTDDCAYSHARNAKHHQPRPPHVHPHAPEGSP